MDLQNNLASALVVRFWHNGQSQHLDEAVTLFTESLRLWEDMKDGEACPGHYSQFLVCMWFGPTGTFIADKSLP
jgi:hypothetical protein